jgi:hypothetical protein
MRLDDHVADIDAYPECNAPFLRLADGKFLNPVLELHSGANRFDRTRKLRQEPVTSVLHDAAAVVRNRGRPGQLGVRGLFLVVHSSRVL